MLLLIARKYTPCLVIIVLALLSFSRNAVWKNEWTLYRDVVGKSPAKARDIHNLGVAALARQDYEAALALFLESREHDRDRESISVNLGIAYVGLKEWDRAHKMFQESIEQDPGDPVPYFNMGQLYYQALGDRDRALPYFLKASQLNPSDRLVHYYLSMIYGEKGMIDLADQELRRYERMP